MYYTWAEDEWVVVDSDGDIVASFELEDEAVEYIKRIGL